MSKIKIQKMSAKEALYSVYSGGPFWNEEEKKREDYILISITDEKDENKLPVRFHPTGTLKAVVRMPFVDVPPKYLNPDKSILEQTGLDTQEFTPLMGRQMHRIADEAKKQGLHILVHCEAGQSRSLAVAAFLELYLNNNASDLCARLYDWNTDYFCLMWEGVAMNALDNDDEELYQKAMLLKSFKVVIDQELEKYRPEDTIVLADLVRIPMGDKDKHELPLDENGKRVIGPVYPDMRMLGLDNIFLLRQLGLDTW